ncbi:hypothetical protein NHP21005_19620 (plasmid) [Helicobacter sp. NHP21005]|uniref:hypothetical protein n=1 Tax=Helicobacter felistomachi TaxID=3040201 RepID=UPI00257328D1|nr:hypothetical protein [Helicobacter sp. NHP21005]BEG58274.1 hypothetical protein NHP21005_19620 [Helicobacter sp. NHP21005]
MPELDKKKAELDDLKTWRSYAVTSLIALIAFVFILLITLELRLVSSIFYRYFDGANILCFRVFMGLL